ncbi:Stk1 family PASTA domain-containing Ser/Thr kinase [Bifidobacterium choloepi]|uniref:non-specific serine/threonine protein kinase n=1 Tax=Bifidobacterium choloepi TaxID=2614131 RepID=A0A6I5N1U8_9BIFI|nr:Stk1 family PASTA domain-containing Ser/Thr kinase [Bifidobacterium choloepi]NEG70135.1 PASTA domain-containing protein [Bifidobacterium choloepi]
MNDDAHLSVGAVIDGRYRIVRKIADGGMATVYQATDGRLGRDVAIKVMHVQLAQGPHRAQFVERFRREAKSAAAIANPHIVQVYDSGETHNLDYLVMEYVEGQNLRQEMTAHTTFTVRETLRVIGETLDGLAAAHRAGVVHRDIKPENILLNKRGRVQITDFGLAKAVSQATLSTTGMLLGTAAYLAPEMIERNLATPQGDCYSVGIMAWEMLAGAVPFQSDNPVTLVFKHVNENVPSIATVCRGIDPKVADFVSYLTAREVGRRPADAGEALARLQALIPQLSQKALDYRYDPAAPQLDTLLDVGASGLSAKFATSDATSAEVNEMWHDSTAAKAATAPDPDAAAADGSSGAPATADDGDAVDGAPTEILRDDDGTLALERHGDDDVPKTTAMPVADDRKHRRRHHHGGKQLPGTHVGAGNETKAKKSHRGLVIALVVVLVLALAGGGGFAAWYYIGPGSYWTLPGSDALKCSGESNCKVTGISWDDYEKTLKVADIPYTVTEEYSDTVPAGDIVSTDPSSVGAKISKRLGESLEVVVSKGVKQATIPSDIMDSSTADGKDPIKALQNAGFTNIVHDTGDDEYSTTVPEGALLSITPDPGTTMDYNAAVTVTLSKGPMPVSMPDVAGKTKDDAAQLFSAAKLNVTYTEEYSDTVAAGTIISTSVAAGTTLHWGDSVSAVVSLGPQMVTLPNVVGMSTDEATSTLEALGLQVKTTAPLGDLTHTVRLMSPSAGESVRVRDADGNPTVVTLTIV